ncbi:MAG: amidase [bacterium]
MPRRSRWFFSSMGLVCFALGALTQSRIEDLITRHTLDEAQKVLGWQFTSSEKELMLDDLRDSLQTYQRLHARPLPYSVPPALVYLPEPPQPAARTSEDSIRLSPPIHADAPKSLEDLAFYSVRDLGELIRARQITSTQLTNLYLERLKKYDPLLNCVITLTEDLALKQARRADEEIAAGHYRGPLHGIPYGAKDLLAVKGYKTTWGAAPYKDQVLVEDATVIQRLEQAGAVLVAKLTTGELAWDDIWFGGQTCNPWNLEQGSSGSSAGPAAAVSAGLAAFAIGSETWGSIVSPCTRCGVTGLRPTFGRVSRTGAMALSWSMDKLGPIARTVEDCAIVLDAIRGADGLDPAAVDRPFRYTPDVDLSRLRGGYVAGDFKLEDENQANDRETLDALRALGCRLAPIALPDDAVNSLGFILSAEAAAAFDELTRSGRDDLLTRQTPNAWPNTFRSARFIPAVEYLQANRLRYELLQKMKKLFDEIDFYVAPSLEGSNSLLTNLTGHPCVVVPNGFTGPGAPGSICFIGDLYDEPTVLAVAKAYQDATGHHLPHPELK